MFDFADNRDGDLTQSSWSATKYTPMFSASEICQGVSLFRSTTHVLFDRKRNALGLGIQGRRSEANERGEFNIVATLPPLFPEWLGDRSFQETHSVRFPYVCGEMANGIASPRMVVAAAQAGLLGFYGSAGLSLAAIEAGIDEIQSSIPHSTWGANLIHTPLEPHLEQSTVDLFIRKSVTRVSASAFMRLSPALVQYACTGLKMQNAKPVRTNYLFAKISRPELARVFMSPPPEKMLADLISEKKITIEEAKIARMLPLSEDITVEADSAGHTDNQVLPAILSTILELRNQLQKTHRYTRKIRVGAAGGIGTPSGAAAAFAMGAAYILTGSVNQSCVESNLDPLARKMLETVSFGDTMMCAAADMFEQGVKLQVLKRGTLYAVRANWLYELYRSHDSLQSLSPAILQRLETEIFRMPLADVWTQTKNFWEKRDPQQIIKASREPKHLMALIFRYYLGLSSRWAIQGLQERQFDYQIWCGPAQAAFNHWVRGTFLEKVENRTVGLVALNILEGAAHILRAGQLRSFGVPVPDEAFEFQAQRLRIEPCLERDKSYV